MAVDFMEKYKKQRELGAKQKAFSEKQLSKPKPPKAPRLADRDTSKDVIGYREVTDEDGKTRQQKTNFTVRDGREGDVRAEYQERRAQGYDGDNDRRTSSRTTSTFDPEEFMRNITDAAIRKKVSTLEGLAEQKRGALAQERSLVAPAFREARTGAKTESELGAKGFSDFLASKGIGGGQQAQGAEQQSEIAQNVALQGQTGALRQQEAGTLADIARREADVETGLASDIASAEAGLEATALQNILNMQLAERDRELQRADLLEGRQYQEGLAAEERARTAEEQTFDEQLRTIGQYAGNYQAEIDRRSAINPNDPLIPYLNLARQEKIQGIEQGQTSAQQNAMDFAMDKWTKGIPLTPQEMQLIGAPTSTRPSGGAGGGLSNAQAISLAKWKFDNGQPLTQQEATLLGVDSVYTQPGQGGIKEELQNIENLITNVPGITQKKNAVVDYLSTRLDDMQGDVAQEIFREYELNENDIERLKQLAISEGTIGGTPGGN